MQRRKGVRRELSVIEFFGMPGAGKTTVAALLAQELRQKGVPIEFNADRIGDDLDASQRHVRRLGMILRELPRIWPAVPKVVANVLTLPIETKAKVKASYNLLTLVSWHARARRLGRVLLLDQGMAQALWSLKLFSKRRDEVDLPDALVFAKCENWDLIVLSAETGSLRQRLSGRASKHSRLQESKWRDDRELWAAGEKLVDEIVARLRRTKPDITIRTYQTEGVAPDVTARVISDETAT